MQKLKEHIIDKYDFIYHRYFENDEFYIYDYTSPTGMTGKLIFIKTIDENYNETFPDLNDYDANVCTIEDMSYLLSFLKERFGKTYIYGENNELLEGREMPEL